MKINDESNSIESMKTPRGASIDFVKNNVAFNSKEINMDGLWNPIFSAFDDSSWDEEEEEEEEKQTPLVSPKKEIDDDDLYLAERRFDNYKHPKIINLETLAELYPLIIVWVKVLLPEHLKLPCSEMYYSSREIIIKEV